MSRFPECTLRVAQLLLALLLVAATGCSESTSPSAPSVPASPYALMASYGDSGAAEGQLRHPVGVAVSGEHLFIADQGNSRIQKWTTSGAFLSQWGSHGAGDGQFFGLSGIAVDDSENVYSVEWNLGNCRVQKFRSDGAWVHGWQVAPAYSSLQLCGICVNHSGQIYVVDFASRYVFKYTNDGTLLTSWNAGDEDGGTSDIALDEDGNVWVAAWGFWIRKFDANGGLQLTISSERGSAAGQSEGWTGLTIDGSGHVLASDLNNGRVAKFSGTGVYLGQFDVPNPVVLIASPARGHLAVDAAGHVFLSDGHANKVLKFAAP